VDERGGGPGGPAVEEHVDRGQVLAGAGVLVGEEPAVGQQPGMVIHDQEQPGPHRGLCLRIRHPRADEHVGDPPLVGAGGLIAAVCLRLGAQCRPVQPGAAQLRADGPLRYPHAVAVEQDRGDLRGGASRQLQPQRGGLGEQFRVRAHRPGVGARRGLKRLQPAGPPCPQPPVDRAPRVAAGRAVGMGVGARGYLPRQRPALRRGQPVTGRLGDHCPAVQRDLLLLLVVHAFCLLMPVMAGQEA